MARNVRAFRERTKPGRCPSCGKKGLNQPHTVVKNGTWSRWRDCRYCGDTFNIDRPSPQDEQFNEVAEIMCEAFNKADSPDDDGVSWPFTDERERNQWRAAAKAASAFFASTAITTSGGGT